MTDSLRLFLIEDQPEEALLIRKSLERAGHQVTVCRTGADALIVLGQAPFDLVILDNQLPDMNGLDLLNTLTTHGQKLPDATEVNMQRALLDHAAYLTKR